MVTDPFQMPRKEIFQRKVVLLPGWAMQMIITAYQNRTAQILKPGLRQKAGKQKRKNEIQISYCVEMIHLINQYVKIRFLQALVPAGAVCALEGFLFSSMGLRIERPSKKILQHDILRIFFYNYFLFF
jgi:hypothetical protein